MFAFDTPYSTKNIRRVGIVLSGVMNLSPICFVLIERHTFGEKGGDELLCDCIALTISYGGEILIVSRCMNKKKAESTEVNQLCFRVVCLFLIITLHLLSKEKKFLPIL